MDSSPKLDRSGLANLGSYGEESSIVDPNGKEASHVQLLAYDYTKGSLSFELGCYGEFTMIDESY